jgi:hypothetical protein
MNIDAQEEEGGTSSMGVPNKPAKVNVTGNVRKRIKSKVNISGIMKHKE